MSEELVKDEKKVETTDKIPKKEEDSTVLLLKKQMEQMEKQMKLQEERYKEELIEKEKAIAEERKKHMSDEQKKEFEKNQELQKQLEQQSKMLEDIERMKKENDEIKKQNQIKEFQNKKLIEKSKYPYIADKIEACEDENQLAFLYKVTNFEKEKAIYENDTNATGSVVKLAGTKSKEDVQPKNPIDEINAKIKKMEEDLIKKRSQPGYRSYY